MNTAALKTFAPLVRRQLMEAVAQKLDFVLSAKTPDYLTTFASQVAALRKLAQNDRDGLVERVAYTWFNRLAALRYLDARGWHPFRRRVLTPASADQTQPEILKVALGGPLPEELREHTNPERLNDLLDGRVPSPNPQGEVYRQIVLAACNFYHALLPDLFERLGDETELLLPDDLLTEQSVAQGFRTEITDDDCAEVEVLGWLYQFYISEKKDAVMGRKATVPTEDIPAVTQLFTPHWIVRYLVENSLGRLWLLNRPDSRLREQMPYYVEGEPEAEFLRIGKPEEIRVLDPAVGSGHMLVYAFDLLHTIYEEEGYAPSEIPGLILAHNLYGVDICPRASQLASLILVLKARDRSRRFFHVSERVHPRIICMKDVQFSEDELHGYVDALNLAPLFAGPVVELLRQFEAATNFGSLIRPCLDEQGITSVRSTIEARDVGENLFLHGIHARVLRVLDQAEMLTQRYQVLVANPPYMSAKGMGPNLKRFAKENFPDSRGDLFAMFLDRTSRLAVRGGCSAMVTMQSWMFLSSYGALRSKILSEGTIITLIQIGYNSFPELNSKIAQACAFVLRNSKDGSAERMGLYLNLNDAPQAADKELVFLRKLHNGEIFRVPGNEFRKLAGTPIAYAMSAALRSAFAACDSLGKKHPPRSGTTTTDNDRFLRLWPEVSIENVRFGCGSLAEAAHSKGRWFPYAKGGGFRKYYGNNDYLINWEDDGRELKRWIENHPVDPSSWSRYIRNVEHYFESGISWGDVTSGFPSFRWQPAGFVSGSRGPMIYEKQPDHLIAYLNSGVVRRVLEILNPSLTFNVGDICQIPLLADISSLDEQIGDRTLSLVKLAAADWDNFETSWDFRDIPFLRPSLKAATLGASWENWKAHCSTAVKQMRGLETANNQAFIWAYGLQHELQPDVPEDQITLARADARRDMAAFLSYAVGCMMGRYSIDKPGLILANAGGTLEQYFTTVGKAEGSTPLRPLPRRNHPGAGCRMV